MNTEKARKLLQEAKGRFAKAQRYEDLQLVAYILRDTEEIKEANLTDLAWALVEGSVSRGDIEGLLEWFEIVIQKEEAKIIDS